MPGTSRLFHHWHAAHLIGMAVRADEMILAIGARNQPDGIGGRCAAAVPDYLTRLQRGGVDGDVDELRLRATTKRDPALAGEIYQRRRFGDVRDLAVGVRARIGDD